MIENKAKDPVVTTATTDIVPVSVGRADRNPALVYLASLSEGSRKTMRQALDEISNLLTSGRADAITLPWWELRFQHTAAVRSRLAEKYAPATANKMLSALRSVLKTSWKLGQMSAEDYHRAADVGSVKGETLPAGRSITAGELVALLDECSRDSSPSGARDAAIIALLYSCGSQTG